MPYLNDNELNEELKFGSSYSVWADCFMQKKLKLERKHFSKL